MTETFNSSIRLDDKLVLQELIDQEIKVHQFIYSAVSKGQEDTLAQNHINVTHACRKLTCPKLQINACLYIQKQNGIHNMQDKVQETDQICIRLTSFSGTFTYSPLPLTGSATRHVPCKDVSVSFTEFTFKSILIENLSLLYRKNFQNT